MERELGSQSRRRRPSSTSCSANSHEKIRGISRRQPLSRRLKSLWLGERIQQGDYSPPPLSAATEPCKEAMRLAVSAAGTPALVSSLKSSAYFLISHHFPFPIITFLDTRIPFLLWRRLRQGRGQPNRPTARRNPHHHRHYHHCHDRHHIFIFTYTALGRCSHAQRLHTPPVLYCLLGAAAER